MPTTTSAQVAAQLLTSLQVRGQFKSQEAIYPTLSTYIDDAYQEHAPDNNMDYSLLTKLEYQLVVLLAWSRACVSRASFIAPDSNMKSAGSMFGSDRDTPFAKNLKLAEYLLGEYHRLKGAIAENAAPVDDVEAAGDITIGDLYRNDELLSARTPLYIAPSMRVSNMAAQIITPDTGGGIGSVVLSWGAMEFENFGEIYLIQSPVAGIYQNWNLDGNATPGTTSTPSIASSLAVIPFCNPAASIIYRTTDSFRKAAKVINLAAGTYYFAFAVRDTTSNYSYSNELTVVIPSQ